MSNQRVDEIKKSLDSDVYKKIDSLERLKDDTLTSTEKLVDILDGYMTKLDDIEVDEDITTMEVVSENEVDIEVDDYKTEELEKLSTPVDKPKTNDEFTQSLSTPAAEQISDFVIEEDVLQNQEPAKKKITSEKKEKDTGEIPVKKPKKRVQPKKNKVKKRKQIKQKEKSKVDFILSIILVILVLFLLVNILSIL